MKKTVKLIVILGVTAIAFTSCNETPYYSDEDKQRIELELMRMDFDLKMDVLTKPILLDTINP